MKVCFWDLETSDLKALMGRVLTCSFLGLDGDAYTFRGDEKKFAGKNLIDDGKLVKAIRDELESYDLIVGHNIRMFDIPFLNARLAKIGERPLRTHFVMDTMYYVGYSSMRIGSKKLDNVQKYFDLPESKTPISWENWQLAASGQKDAMDVVVEHNIHDVLVLRELYPHLLPYVSTLHR